MTKGTIVCQENLLRPSPCYGSPYGVAANTISQMRSQRLLVFVVELGLSREVSERVAADCYWNEPEGGVVG